MEEVNMLAAKGMLAAISRENHIENHNNDHDLGTVLKAFGNDVVHQHKLRYSDGKEEKFLFYD